MIEPRGPIALLPSRREDALAIVLRLRNAGHEAYLAGGCVRDQLLGLEPKDYDVATDAPPQRVRELFPHSQAVGAAFGVVLVHLGQSIIEVATFRTDGTYTDGRRPDAVQFTTADQDARRRDFTINGLFLDPIDNHVIDHVGGQQDLRDRVLRAIGDPTHRFGEDYLRMLRAVRFAARFGLSIEPATHEAIIKFAARLTQISPERIADELRLMLTAESRVRAWELLAEFGFLPIIYRFVPGADPTLTSPEPRILRYLPAGSLVTFPLALTAGSLDYLPPSVHKAVVSALRKSLRLSNSENDALAQILRVLELLDAARSPTVARLKRFLATDTAADAKLLLDALAAARPALAGTIRPLQAQLAELSKGDFAPPPLLTGDDLVAAGLQPGPSFKRILELTYDEQLEGRITTRDQAMAFGLNLK